MLTKLMKKTHQLEPEFLDLNVQLIVFGSLYKTVNLYQNEINYCGLFCTLMIPFFGYNSLLLEIEWNCGYIFVY